MREVVELGARPVEVAGVIESGEAVDEFLVRAVGQELRHMGRAQEAEALDIGEQTQVVGCKPERRGSGAREARAAFCWAVRDWL